MICERADEFAALKRPAIWFDCPSWVDADDEPTPIGATRFGGEPDLPPNVAWPTVDGEVMTFAAQLDLDGPKRYSAARELPATGLLSFFYAFGDDARVPARVLHIATRDGRRRRAAIAGRSRRQSRAASR